MIKFKSGSFVGTVFLFLFSQLQWAQSSPLDLRDLARADEKVLSELTQQALKTAQGRAQEILKVDYDSVSISESFGKYDRARMDLLETLHFVELVSLVSPNDTRREQAKDLAVLLRQGLKEIFDDRLSFFLLQAGEVLKKKVALDSEEGRLIDFILADLRFRGMGLSQEERKQLLRIESEIAALSSTFDKNIQDLNGTVEARLEELDGMDPKLLQGLKKNEASGKYILGTDYPTVGGVLQQVTSNSLRRRVFSNFYNRAYPENYKILYQLNQARQEMAKLLQHSSYSSLDLSNQMSGTQEAVQEFLDTLVSSAEKRVGTEVAKLKGIASDTEFNSKGQLFPWSIQFLRYQYAKKELGVDLAKVKEYFPVDQTLARLFAVLEKQFGITVALDDATAWDPEVKVVTVAFEGKVRGQVYLDLYPREGKYTHGRVMIVRPAQKDPFLGIVPGQAAILTNFTRPLPDKPALFTWREVQTLFHEFGHALHALLIETQYSFMDSGEMAITYGLPVKTDFVELPSQMLEFFLEDPLLVQNLSHHYQTGEPLKLEWVQALIDQNNTFQGLDVLGGALLSQFALQLFSGVENEKTFDQLWHQLNLQYKPFQAVDEDSHYPASFLHLTSYGAKYYGYSWTEVFAADLFSVFRKAGLLNQELGKKYCREVLAKGGSVHPKVLLESFLGRPLSQEAFLQNLDQMPESGAKSVEKGSK